MSENISNKVIKIDNFNLSIFGNLLSQSLIVNPELMLEFSGNMIKSCSFSVTNSLVKLWTVPVDSLIVKPKAPVSIESLDDDPETPAAEDLTPKYKFEETFNFYILKGLLFKNYINVFNQTSVNLEINISFIENKWQATSIKISGESIANGSPLTTTFALTFEELLTNKVGDYSEVLTECTPDKDMFQIQFDDKNIAEIKSLVKTLKGASVNNVAYLSFEITKNKIVVSDKVFNLEFPIPVSDKPNQYNLDEKLCFNVLKSDFTIIGNHSFTIFTNLQSPKVIFGTAYSKSIIWCLANKFDTTKQVQLSNTVEEADELIDALNLDMYGLGDI